MRHKILIVDDDRLVGLALKKILKSQNYNTKIATCGKTAKSDLYHFQPEVVLLDFKLPDTDGFALLKHIKQLNDNIIVIMITSFGEVRNAVTAMKLGAYDFFSKPFDEEEILQTIEQALLDAAQKMDISPQFVVGKSEIMQTILQKIERIAPTDISVFLEGETGTGKELLARMIHRNSKRSTFPFVVVDCGAIPEHLLESELFGHKKGAFTGALFAKKGKFELANKGTLFLDEINNLSLSLQPKLLRVLQEKEIQRLGEEKPIPIDVRILTASNQKIQDDVSTGSFREDLFFRLHEFKLEIPPLRNRKSDILTIANFFLQNISIQYNQDEKELSERAKQKLLNHAWPGNIRELKNAIKSAVLISTSKRIEETDIVLHHINNGNVHFEEQLNENSIQHAEIRIIKKALKKTNFNKAEAAKMLGISRSQFYKKLEKFEIL